MSEDKNEQQFGRDLEQNSVQAYQPGVLSKIWNSKALAPLRVAFTTAKVLTFPVWVPEKYLVMKPALWVWKNAGGFGKTLAAAYGLAGTAAIFGAAAYGAAFLTVETGNTKTFLNWPATEGQWRGEFVRWSHKGTAPCDSWEGGIRTGDASPIQNFAVSRWDADLIEKLDHIFNEPGTAEVALTYRDNGLPQEFFGTIVNNPVSGDFDRLDPTLFGGCIQHFDHTGVDVRETTSAPRPN